MKKQKTKKQTALDRQIKQLNAAYKRATPTQRRRMIVEDALKQIKNGTITPEMGLYVSLREPVATHRYAYVSSDEPLQPVLLKGQAHCECCAKGALFVSCVRLSNRYNGNPTGIDSDMINDLVGWPEDNYNLIEEAFESLEGEYWYDTYPKDKDRLVAILKNILSNKSVLFTTPKEQIEHEERQFA